MSHVHHHVARSPVLAEWHANQAKIAQQPVEENVVTITSVIWVSGDQTTAPAEPQSTLTSTTTMQLSSGPSADSTASSTYSAPSRIVRPVDSSTGLFAPTSTPAADLLPTSIAVASSTGGAAAAIATSGDFSQSTQSSGMSGGAKAGLAFGIIIIVALIAAAVFFFVRHKKQGEDDGQQRLDDEKSEMRQRPQSIASQSRTNAPRLSIRPLTQLFNMGSEKQDASALVASSAAAAAARAHTPEPAVREPVMHESSNPFGDHAEEKTAITAPAAAASSVPSSNASDRTLSNLSERSPSEQGFPAAVAGSRRNSPPGPGPNNVHRVQLDFKPSMEDELELRAGSLVRLLHEYDDGWALCIRLDRSQQGVVPRTCVSKLPVKPRPAPPPSMRGPPPQGQGRPGPRPAPNGHPRGPPPAGRMRSQSNTPGQQSRPESPALAQNSQQARPRSNSDAMNPSSVPARKQTPGQAM